MYTWGLHWYKCHATVHFPIPIKVTRCPYGSSSNVGTSEHESILKVDFKMSYELGMRTRVVTRLPYFIQSLLKLLQCRRSCKSNVGTSEHEGILKVDFQMSYELGLRTRVVTRLPYIFQSLSKILQYRRSSQSNVGTSDHGGIFVVLIDEIMYIWGLHAYNAVLPYFFPISMQGF